MSGTDVPQPITAAKGMPLPEGLVDKLTRRIQSAITTYWGDKATPVGDASLLVAMQLVLVPVETFDGKKITDVQVHLEAKRVHALKAIYGAYTYMDGSSAHVALQIAGDLTGELIHQRLCEGTEQFDLRRILIHELTHVLDVDSDEDGFDPEASPKAYINSKSELKAYGNEIWHHIIEDGPWYAGSEVKILQRGESAIWEIIAGIMSKGAMALIQEHLGAEGRRYLLQVAYRALREVWGQPAPGRTAAAEPGSAKADLQRIRPILREWVAGGWTDGPQLLRLLEKHKDVLAKFRMKKPMRLWRNERIQGPDNGWGNNNHGWEDQYTRPTAWSATREEAASYAFGPHRRLVTAIVPPEDTYCYLPAVDQAARDLGFKTFDPHRQDEVIVRPNPSFLAQIRPPVKFTREEEAKVRADLREKLTAFYAPQVERMQKERPGSAMSIGQSAEERIKGMVSSISTEDLPERAKEWEAQIQQGSKTGAAKQAEPVQLDLSWLAQLRKDFLTLMGNLSRVSSYEQADTLRIAFNTYRKRFEDLFFTRFLNSDLKRAPGLTPSQIEMADAAIRAVAWTFNISLQLPLDVWQVDDGIRTEAQVFAAYQRNAPKWEASTRRKAQAFWRGLREMLEIFGGEAKGFEVDGVSEEIVEIEGFRCEVRDYRPEDADRMGTTKAGLRLYRENAGRYLPLLLAYQLPIVIDFRVNLDTGGEYRDRTVVLYATSAADSPSQTAHTVAHEMGHHLYRALGHDAINSWYRTVMGDWGTLDLRELLDHWPGDAWAFQFGRIIGRENPILALQVEALAQDLTCRSLQSKEDFQRLLDSGQTTVRVPRTPITGYANKNPEEAFCEAIGMLVAYGPQAVHERVRHWLDWVLPETSKTASAC